jgi:uncharacterized membrane protein
MQAQLTPVPAPAQAPTRWQKPTLWAILGALTLFVAFQNEIPLLLTKPEQTHLRSIVWLVVPHILAGLTALLLGPLQFSTRLRQRSPQLHRIIGRVYVGSVFVAAPLAIILTVTNHNPQPLYFNLANSVQAGTWMIATAAALLTARNRHFQQHRAWMVRSYAVTFTFIALRVPRVSHAWNVIGRPGAAMMVILFTFMAILVPDIALTWRELTQRRA